MGESPLSRRRCCLKQASVSSSNTLMEIRPHGRRARIILIPKKLRHSPGALTLGLHSHPAGDFSPMRRTSRRHSFLLQQSKDNQTSTLNAANELLGGICDKL